MSSAGHKRQRANTHDETANRTNAFPTANIDCRTLIDTFDTKTLRSLLLDAAQQSPAVASAIAAKYRETIHTEASRIIDFDHHSKLAWRALSNADKMQGSKAWEACFDVTQSIQASVDKIVSSTSPHSSFGTKQSALYTLRKICKTIILSSHQTCGREVCRSFAEDHALENAMSNIVDKIDEVEKTLVGQDEEWVAKMEELIELGEGIDMCATLQDVLDELVDAGDSESS
ncbi:MAG: hypothetical protein Q9170_005222 [Blastenia crenularia]